MNNSYWNSQVAYYKKHFNTRVQKLSVNLGLSCPNRDGTKSTKGCIYCNNEAFTPSYCKSNKTIKQQLLEGMEFHQKRYRRANKYLAYFQSYSNTYVENESLEKCLKEALSLPDIIGAIIATRPDCVNIDNINILKHFSKTHFIKVELGLESLKNETLEFVNRCHTVEDSFNAINLLYQNNIPIGAHFIIGLPTDTLKDWLIWAKEISELPITSIKLHQLQVIKNTELEKIYQNNKNILQILELNQYIDFIVQFVERLRPTLYIERLASEVPPKYLIAPDWGLIRYDQIQEIIKKEFQKRQTYQGKFFSN